MTNNENKTNEINPEALKQWFAEIKDPKQQAIHTNIEILKLETYVKDRNFAKQELEETQERIKNNCLLEVTNDVANTNDLKRKNALASKLEHDEEYQKNNTCIEAIKQDIINTELNISFYKRTFQILIMFANEWVKING
jgi:hypothetical protein